MWAVAVGRAREATRPLSRADPDVRRQAYRTKLFRHAFDVASASSAAIAFHDVGAARSVRLTLSGQPCRFAGHGFLCRLRMPVSPLSRSGARLTVPMTESPREAARPLPAPIPACDAKRTAPGSSPLPWPSLRMTNSAPSCSPHGANISTLQDSLDVTGCCFAPHSLGDTSLPWPDRQGRQHIQSPRCTGRLLRDLLVVITTGLAA